MGILWLRTAVLQGFAHGIGPAWMGGMMTVFCMVLAFAAAGFFTEMIAASHAPLGYQDENGFHFGQPSAAAHSASFDIENPS